MGSTSKYGRAVINPSAPSALGVCDRCGQLHNLHNLRFQFQWAGTGMINKQIRVCRVCYDVPSEQLRAIILPADPPAVWQPRPEPYLVDEVNEYWLRAVGQGVPMFRAASDLQAVFGVELGMLPAFTGGSDLAVSALLGIGITGALSDASDLAADALLGIGISAALSDASDLAAELTQVVPSGVERTLTDTFSVNASGNHTETGVAFGTATADRLIVLSISGVNGTSVDGIDSVTIAGVGATSAVEVVRNLGGFGVGGFSVIYWALVSSGTSGNIEFVFTGDDLSFDVIVYSVTGADTVTPVSTTNTASVASGDASAAVTIGADSATFSSSMLGLGDDFAATWTNITEDAEFYDGASVNTGGASRQDVASPGSTTITVSTTGTPTLADKTLAIAVFEP